MKIHEMKLMIAGLGQGLDIANEEKENLQRALDYVLPYVHVDIRDKALQIARGEGQTPLEDYIGSLGADQPT